MGDAQQPPPRVAGQDVVAGADGLAPGDHQLHQVAQLRGGHGDGAQLWCLAAFSAVRRVPAPTINARGPPLWLAACRVLAQPATTPPRTKYQRRGR
jgi:hypothetical protein